MTNHSKPFLYTKILFTLKSKKNDYEKKTKHINYRAVWSKKKAG